MLQSAPLFLADSGFNGCLLLFVSNSFLVPDFIGFALPNKNAFVIVVGKWTVESWVCAVLQPFAVVKVPSAYEPVAKWPRTHHLWPQPSLCGCKQPVSHCIEYFWVPLCWCSTGKVETRPLLLDFTANLGLISEVSC